MTPSHPLTNTLASPSPSTPTATHSPIAGPSSTLISTAKPLFEPDSSDDEPSPAPARAAPAPRRAPSAEVMLLSDDGSDVAPYLASQSSPISNGKGKAREVLPVDGDWTSLFVGEFLMQGYTTASSGKWCSLLPLDPVHLTRDPPPPPVAGKKAKDSLIVRFRNARSGQEVGRVANEDAEWICRLLDLGTAKFEGVCVDVKNGFRSGDTVLLSLRASLRRTAFTDANAQKPITTTSNKSTDKGKGKGKGAGFHEDAKESGVEKRMRERRHALEKLFNRCELLPVGAASQERSKTKKGAGSVGMAISSSQDEEEELEQSRIDEIYAKTMNKDKLLPEAEPSENFALNLRPYQKQALGWMTRQESLTAEAREETSIHPLWKEYNFPPSPGNAHSHTHQQLPPFYYCDTSGDLSLEFPRASKCFRGGILADEMGLGKTIMVASLILSATPELAAIEDAQRTPEPETEVLELLSDSSEDEGPATKKSKFFGGAGGGQQAKLSSSGNVVKTIARKAAHKTPRATLVVAPMTLLAQWVEELERSSQEDIYVLMYYGASRTDLREEMKAGCDVVVTSYGTLASEWKKAGFDQEGKKAELGKDGKRKKLSSGAEAIKKTGLFGVEWFRVVLDEAHSIKSRTTLNARAAYSLRASRRWALTGTPIVNRLEDLYSLVRFLGYEPWSNFSWFRTCITVPFEQKDPKAMKTIQHIVERVLLRREKKMKDRDGNPIVALPKKHVKDVTLKLSREEKEIYDAVYANVKDEFGKLIAQGGVGKNVTAIFALLMRLRQAVLHPALLLKRIAQNASDSRSAGVRPREDEGKIQRLIEAYGGATATAIKDDGDDELSALVCAICLEPMESPVFLPDCDHHACRDCLVDHFGQMEEQGNEAACPACEGGPTYSVNTVEKILVGAGTQQAKEGKSYSIAPSSPETSFSVSSNKPDVLTIDDSSDEDEQPVKVKPRAARVNLRERKQVVKNVDDSSDDSDSEVVLPMTKVKDNDEDFKMGIVNDSASDEDDDDKGAALIAAGSSARAGGMLEDKFRSSTKLDALIASLLAARASDPQLKAVVFTQFSGFMDLIERALNRENFPNVRLDGTLAQKTRAKVVTEFTTTKKSCVLVASLKAGGVGLNLIAATHVYICDLWWNAATENQAVDRIHRFGQTREVHVTRFLVEDSIDDKMAQLQLRKTAVVRGALAGAEEKNGGARQLEEDFRLIFGDE